MPSYKDDLLGSFSPDRIKKNIAAVGEHDRTEPPNDAFRVRSSDRSHIQGRRRRGIDDPDALADVQPVCRARYDARPFVLSVDQREGGTPLSRKLLH